MIFNLRKIKIVKVHKDGEVSLVKTKDHSSGCTRIQRIFFYLLCPAHSIVQRCPCQILFQGKRQCNEEDHHGDKSKQMSSMQIVWFLYELKLI